MTLPRMFRRRVLAAAALSATLAVVASPAALAHDLVIGGNPADGEVVEEFPRRIELEFSGLPQGSFSTIALSNQASGEILFSGKPTLEGQKVILDLPEEVTGGPGDYTIGFQITSSDGHATRDTTTFTVAGTPSSPAAAAPADGAAVQPADSPVESATADDATADAAPSSGLGGTTLVILTGVGLLAALTALTLVIRRRR